MLPQNLIIPIEIMGLAIITFTSPLSPLLCCVGTEHTSRTLCFQ